MITVYAIKNFIKQVVCWILLLQIINISINLPDINYPNYRNVLSKEDVSIDELESVYELIAEDVFNKEVPESDEDEIDTSSQPFELYFFTKTCSKLPALAFPAKHFSRYQNNFLSIFQEPHLPPPKIS